MAEYTLNRTVQQKHTPTLVILAIFFAGTIGFCPPSWSQTATQTGPAELVEKIIDAQISYDYVALAKLQKQLSSIDKEIYQQPKDLSGARRYAFTLATQAATGEKTENLRQFVKVVRKMEGVSDQLLEAELLLGELDAMQQDCYTAFQAQDGYAGRLSSRDPGQIWAWLGLVYTLKKDNKRAVACFTIWRRPKTAIETSDSLPHILPTWQLSSSLRGVWHSNNAFYPVAYRNYQQAEKELKAESEDRAKLQYGGE